MIKLSGVTNEVSRNRSESTANYKKDFEWESKLRLVARFYDDYHRRPRFSTQDSYEVTLARWLNTQIVSMNSETLRSDREALVRKQLPWLLTRRVQTFEDRIRDLKDFVSVYGRMPKNTLDEEKALAQWLHGERVKYKKDLLSTNRRTLLESVPNALSKQTHSDTYQMCIMAIGWCEYHGYLPRMNISNSRELNSSEREESRLGAWMRNHSRTGIRARESAESVFRREIIIELYRTYPSWTEYRNRLEAQENDSDTDSAFSHSKVASESYFFYKWRNSTPSLKRLAELVFLEDEISNWWGRGSRYARNPSFL